MELTPDGNAQLPRCFDLHHDIKNTVQLRQEMVNTANKLASMVSLCKHYGVSVYPEALDAINRINEELTKS